MVSDMYSLFASTFDPSTSTRQAAEARLKEASLVTSFAPNLLQLITAQEGDTAVKQAAAVFFKNWIENYWTASEGEGDKFEVDQGDRQVIRDSLVKAIGAIGSFKAVRTQLLASLCTIIRADVPQRFPNIHEQIYALIQGSQTMIDMETGLLAFYQLVNWRGYGPDATALAEMYGNFFPKLILPVAQQALEFAKNQADPNQRDDALWVVKAAMKCLFAAVRYRWAPALLADEHFLPWATLMNDLLSMPVPKDNLAEMQEALTGNYDLVSDLERTRPFWKARKWAMHTQNRVLLRYVSKADMDSFTGNDGKQVVAFAKLYANRLAQPILETFLKMVSQHLSGPFIAPRAFSLICDYFSACVRFKPTWRLLQPNLMPILQAFIFPAACWTAQDDVLWEDDPQECIRSRFVDSLMQDVTSVPAFSAVNLIVDIIKCRRKHALMPFLGFLTQRLAHSQAPSDRSSACTKEGIFYTLGSMSRLLMSDDALKAQMENFIISFVVPVLTDPKFPFLQARGCWVIEQLLGDKSEFKFSDPSNVMTLLKAIIQCLLDVNNPLPVRVQAALAFSPILDFEEVQQAIPAALARVVESILQVSEQIDLDALAFTLERIVSMFPDELAPFAVQLCTQLVHTFVRILDSYKALSESNPDQDAYFEESDKMMAAIGMLSAINTLIESMSTSSEIMAQLEPVCLPMTLHILNTNSADFFEETFELLDSITFSRKTVTPQMWTVFEAMYRVFKYTQSGPDYLNDMYTTLDNIVTYGRAEMPPTHIAAAVDIVEAVFRPRIQEYTDPQATEPHFSEADLISACKLAESLMLNISTRLSDEQFVKLLDLATCSLVARQRHNQFKVDDEKFRGGFHTIACYVTQLQVILNGFYFDAMKTLQVLEHRNFSATLFDVWFVLAPKVLTRVHDRRLNVIAIHALLRLPQLPTSISSIWTSKAVPVLLDAIHGLPASLSTRARLQKEFEEASDEEDDEDEFLDDSEYDEIQDSDGEEEAMHERNFLKSHLHPSSSQTLGDEDGEDGYRDDEDEYNSDYEDAADQLEEELYFETVLDNVDFVATSKQTVALLKPELLSNLSMEQRQFLHTIA